MSLTITPNNMQLFRQAVYSNTGVMLREGESIRLEQDVLLSVLNANNISYTINGGGKEEYNIISDQCFDGIMVVNHNQTTCSVCLEEIREKEKTIRLKCNHTYHKSCILDYIKFKNACALCREPIPIYINNNTYNIQ